MNSKSIFELKNIFSSKEQLSIGQQLHIKGGDDDKRREDIATKTTTTTITTATATITTTTTKTKG